MQTRFDAHPGAVPATRLLVLLPPAEATLDDFFTQGFVQAVRQRGIAADILLAGVNYQHVMARTVASALAAQLLPPAQAGRYREIWVAGISLGAFSALHFAAVHGKALAGLHLMAPYPGTRDILREIGAAGGVLAWAHSPLGTDVDERRWWRWLAGQAQTGQWELPVYLSTGLQDRFLPGQRLLGDLLPAQRVRYTAGGHDWQAWKPMWEHWLDQGPLATPLPACASEPPPVPVTASAPLPPPEPAP